MSESITKSGVKCQSRVSQRAMSKQSFIKSNVKCHSRVPQRAMSNVRKEFPKEQCQMSEQSFTKSDVKCQTFYLQKVSPNNNVMLDSILVAVLMPKSVFHQEQCQMSDIISADEICQRQCQMSEQCFTKSLVKRQMSYLQQCSSEGNVNYENSVLLRAMSNTRHDICSRRVQCQSSVSPRVLSIAGHLIC